MQFRGFDICQFVNFCQMPLRDGTFQELQRFQAVSLEKFLVKKATTSTVSRTTFTTHTNVSYAVYVSVSDGTRIAQSGYL